MNCRNEFRFLLSIVLLVLFNFLIESNVFGQEVLELEGAVRIGEANSDVLKLEPYDSIQLKWILKDGMVYSGYHYPEFPLVQFVIRAELSIRHLEYSVANG